MKRVIILLTQSGDWEGLFIDGKLITEGHNIGGGNRLTILELAEEYGFTSKDVSIDELTDEDEEFMSTMGSFPSNLSGLSGKYYGI